jgi:hypothetical protein
MSSLKHLLSLLFVFSLFSIFVAGCPTGPLPSEKKTTESQSEPSKELSQEPTQEPVSEKKPEAQKEPRKETSMDAGGEFSSEPIKEKLLEPAPEPGLEPTPDASTEPVPDKKGCETQFDCDKPKVPCKDTTNSSGQKVCRQYTASCQNKRCVELNKDVLGATCNKQKGICETQPTCSTPCDCPQQGMDCAGGKCIVGKRPVYCCSKSGCPKGDSCVDKQNQKGTCGTTGTCKQDSDCGKRTCQNNGPDCSQTVPVCSQGQCRTLNQKVLGAQCDNAIGRCRVPKPTCKVDCDCAQGLMCVKGSDGKGQCIAGFVPVYCCNKPGCPAGKPCKDTAGGASTCP